MDGVTSPRRWWSSGGLRDQAAYQRTFSEESRSAAARLQLVWTNIAVPKDRERCALLLKHVIRRGVTDQFRPGVWLALCNSATIDVAAFGAMQTVVFGPTVPDEIANVPAFGGSLDAIQDYPLSAAGVKAAHRVLVMLAMLQHLDHLPTLLDLVCTLLLFVSEAEAYFAVSSVVSLLQSTHLAPTKKAHELMLATLEDLISWHTRNLHAHFKRMQVRPAEFASRWFLRLFAGSFPLPTMLRIFDAFLNEGSKILYRAVIGFLKLHKQRLLQTNSKQELLDCIRQLASQQHDADNLMKTGFGLQLSREHTKRLDLKNHPKVAHIANPPARAYHRPRIAQRSAILADVQFETLWSWVPNTVSIRDPLQLYSASKQGYSLSSLLRAVDQRSPTLLIFKTNRSEVFGAYASCPWPPSDDRNKSGYYFGDRSCFVWTLVPTAAKYGWSEKCPHAYFQHVSSSVIQIGGGDGIALQLDDELRIGRTTSCSSFLSPPLTADRRESFECVAVEVYGFI